MELCTYVHYTYMVPVSYTSEHCVDREYATFLLLMDEWLPVWPSSARHFQAEGSLSRLDLARNVS